MGLVADNQNCIDLFLNELNNNQKTNIIQLIGRGISFYNLDDITSYYDALVKLEGDINELAKYNSLYERISSLSEGNPSPNFKYKNMQGERVSLTSLKGKLVYIDVWATWCGPCKAQIPYLKQLEELYRNKDIEFVSISIDQPKDEEKWRKMVVEKELKGIQLIADDAWKSLFVKDYVIQGIPRFILLDKKGNIISPSAPRPGQYVENGDMSLNSDIKDLINQYLD
jgi:thiol-disulfide isomerase/thioredoxin